MPNMREEASVTLDLEKIAAEYAASGYALVRGALSREEMKPIQEQWQRLRGPLQAGDKIDGVVRNNFYIHGKLPEPVGDVYRHPTIVAIAKRLLGPDVALYLNRLNVKDTAFTDLIHLHQDMPYFNGGSDKINMFVALQDINLNNGAMVYIPRSHELGILDRDTIDISKHSDLDVIVPSLQPGDLIIADIRLWHSSVPNTAGTDRVLLQMIVQPSTDGSWYPPSLPEPQLVAGTWRTDDFPQWEPNVAPGGDMTGAPADDQMQVDQTQVDQIQVDQTQVDQMQVASPAQTETYFRMSSAIKSVVPVTVKRAVKNIILQSSKKKVS